MTAKRRKTRAAVAKAVAKTSKHIIDEQFPELEPNFEMKLVETLPGPRPLERSMNALVVTKTTALPLCAADHNIPVHWYQCGRCGVLFDSTEKMKIHHQEHKNGKRLNRNGNVSTEALIKVADNELMPPPDMHQQAEQETVSKRSLTEDSLTPATRNISSVSQDNEVDVAKSPPTPTSSRNSTRNGATGDLECSICNKNFSSRRDLKFHMGQHNEAEKSIHLGGNPGKKGNSSFDDDELELPDFGQMTSFVCTYCSKQFAYENTLKRHMRNHVGDETSTNRNSNMLNKESNIKSSKQGGGRFATAFIRAASLAKMSRGKEKSDLNSYSPMSP